MTYDKPAKVVGAAAAWIFGAILVVIVLVGLWLAMFFGHFWLFAYSVNKQAHIINEGYAHQTALKDDLAKQIGEIISDDQLAIRDKNNSQLLEGDHAAALNAAGHACADAADLTLPLSGSEKTWVDRHCLSGNYIGPTPPPYK